MLEKLKNIAQIHIEKSSNPETIRKYELIKKLLEDSDCFFKIPVDSGINILLDLGFTKEEAIKIYQELISYKNYK